MRTSRSFQLYTTFLFLCFSTFTSAWPWPRWLPELDALIVRDATTSGSAASQTTTAASTKATGSSNSNTISQTTTTGSTTASKDSTTTDTNSGSAATTSGSSNSDSNSNSTTAAATTSTSYDATYPAGGISLLTPAVASGSQYYKIGDYVTFVWNYTSLEATPTAVDIMATCTVNQQLYTIAMNATVPTNGTQKVVWDTGSYQATAVSDPLLTETYTLIIYDAASSISAVAEAGYLSVYDSYAFGMYTGQPYTPLNEFQCATCSSALSDMERRVMGLVLGMSVITVLSFTWFVGGTGVIW